MEIRTLRRLQVRDAATGSGHIGVLTGHAAVFDSDSVEFAGWGRPWIERIAPGAFARSLKENPDVVALWSHRTDAPIARAPQTLRLAEDAEGLAVEISLVDTQRNRDLLAEVRSGVVDAMSFGFEVKSEKWEKGEARDLRTLLDVDLFEVSPVVFPAYPGTSISARSAVAFGDFSVDEMRAAASRRDAALGAATPPPAPEQRAPSYSYTHWALGIRAGRPPA